MEMKDKDDYAMADAWRQKYTDWVNTQPVENCTITSDRGDLLRGYYLPPKGDSKVIVFGSHGFHADHTVDPHTFIKHYHDLGYGFFCCDHVGAGASGGEYVGFDYYESQDMLRWIEYLTARFGQDITVILHGVSMGAATVLQLAGSRCPDCVKLIISDCAWPGLIWKRQMCAKACERPRCPFSLSTVRWTTLYPRRWCTNSITCVRRIKRN